MSLNTPTPGIANSNNTKARESAERDIAAMPASERVRARITASGKRFHANDNISEFIREGEVGEIQDEVAAKLREARREDVLERDFSRSLRRATAGNGVSKRRAFE
jgi:hypothetical protein